MQKRADSIVDGLSIRATVASAAHSVAPCPLLIGLHGGGYTSQYFTVAGSAAGSFVDIANRNGFDVLLIDRPGYGGSDPLPADEAIHARQAETLNRFITMFLGEDPRPVVLVGQSIGGMISLEIAALRPTWRLIGVATSAMGARLSASGVAEQFGAIPGDGQVDLPVEARNQILYGPASTVFPDVLATAQGCYAPAPIAELSQTARWASERLDCVAAAVGVPVHHTVGEYDVIWEATPDAVALFGSKFGSAAPVSSEIAGQAGHSVDHHRVGAAMHYRQLAFAHSCALT